MHILSCLQRPVLRMILSTDLKTVAFINLACAHQFLLEKGVQAVKQIKVHRLDFEHSFFSQRGGGSVRVKPA